MPDSAYIGHVKLWWKFYVMEAKKGLSGKAPKMFLWTWIFQNWAIFLFWFFLSRKSSHFCGFDTPLVKFFRFWFQSKIFFFFSFHMLLGIIYQNFINLGQKMRSRPQKWIFQEKIWKSLKKIKMTISQPLLVLDQNPLGCKDYLGKWFKPCPNCMDIWQLKFLPLVTPKKNGHLIFKEI